MAVDPRILQQYIDAYNQKQNTYGRQVDAYNAAVNTYNAALPKWQQLYDPAMNRWRQEVEHINIPGIHSQDNINYHIGEANMFNQNLYGIEKQLPMAPSALNGLFNEKAYLANNPDVAAAVANGSIKSGLDHYLQWGRNENRLGVAAGGVQNQKLAKQAADWQKNAEAAYLQLLDEQQHVRTLGIHNQDNINYHNDNVARYKAAYESLMNQLPGMPEFTERQPTFTQEQVKAMTGNVGLGKQMLQQEGGLIGAELASTTNERSADSMIAGILSQARGRG